MQLRTAKKVVTNVNNIKKVCWTNYTGFIKRFNLQCVVVNDNYTYYANEDKSKEVVIPSFKNYAFISDNY